LSGLPWQRRLFVCSFSVDPLEGFVLYYIVNLAQVSICPKCISSDGHESNNIQGKTVNRSLFVHQERNRSHRNTRDILHKPFPNNDPGNKKARRANRGKDNIEFQIEESRVGSERFVITDGTQTALWVASECLEIHRNRTDRSAFTLFCSLFRFTIFNPESGTHTPQKPILDRIPAAKA
jgi:hypothetical protein